LDSRAITTQRELADHAGISLGQVNYVLKSFLERGLVKITNFAKTRKKISYVYQLTPKGLEVKSSLAARFVLRKLKEYGDVKDKLAERLNKYQEERRFRVFFLWALSWWVICSTPLSGRETWA
jgi:EPS-associated MarR family transcriptional regulator